MAIHQAQRDRLDHRWAFNHNRGGDRQVDSLVEASHLELPRSH